MFNNIEIEKKTGSERFEHIDNRRELQLIDFWRWEHSDLMVMHKERCWLNA